MVHGGEEDYGTYGHERAIIFRHQDDRRRVDGVIATI